MTTMEPLDAREERDAARHQNVQKAIAAADQILTSTATSEEELNLMTALVAKF